MKNIYLFSIVFLLVVAAMFKVYAPQASRVAPNAHPEHIVEVSPLDITGDYMLCGIDMPDSEIVLVSTDIAKCGDSISLKFADGSIIAVQVAGILLHAPKNTAQAFSVQGTEFTRVSVYH